MGNLSKNYRDWTSKRCQIDTIRLIRPAKPDSAFFFGSEADVATAPDKLVFFPLELFGSIDTALLQMIGSRSVFLPIQIGYSPHLHFILRTIPLQNTSQIWAFVNI